MTLLSALAPLHVLGTVRASRDACGWRVSVTGRDGTLRAHGAGGTLADAITAACA